MPTPAKYKTRPHACRGQRIRALRRLDGRRKPPAPRRPGWFAEMDLSAKVSFLFACAIGSYFALHIVGYFIKRIFG